MLWSDWLLWVSWFKRREYFKLWNQIQASEDAHLSTEEKWLKIRSKMDEPKPVKLPAGIQFISMADSRYPKVLLELPQPPVGLYVKGDPSLGPLAGIVGSRKPTPYARRMTRTVAKIWVEKGYGIISGGAFGVDAEAHKSALDFKGRTVVVLGGGLLKLYPKHHHKLFEEVLNSKGVLISEYPPYEEARPYYFPERNRIIAALSDIFFLAQAHEKSGSLSTARTALDLGREIYVLRPVAGDENFAGSASLIDDGANCLIDATQLTA